MNSSDFAVTVEFSDGVKVSLGAGDEFFVEPSEGAASAYLDDKRLALIRRLREASEASVEG